MIADSTDDPTANPPNKPKLLDLFSGVGGLALGFEQSGFRVHAGVDISKKNTLAFRSNFPSARTLQRDVKNLSGETIRRETGLDDERYSVLVGGPPCQGFSMIGKRDKGDPRNSLVFEIARLAAELDIDYFVMEQVGGFVTSTGQVTLEKFVERAQVLGYDVVEPAGTLDAQHFGVPQKRERIFVIGYRRGLRVPAYPKPSIIVNGQLALRPNVRDAISDLPNISQIRRLLRNHSVQVELGKPSTYAAYMRSEIRDPSDHTEDRPQDECLLTHSKRTVHQRITRRRFLRTAAGAHEPVSRFHKLSYDGLSNTLRAGTGRDKGAHTAARPIHPDEARCITVREAARLHSFPDWFRFDETIWHGFMQIGNSVPPLLARAVGAEIMKAINPPE